MNVPENNMLWDYRVKNPEGIHALMHLIGIPSVTATHQRRTSGLPTYTLNKEDGSSFYIKWHLEPEAGIETMDSQSAERLAGSEPDYHAKDLFNKTEKGDYPT
ncbi:hypothetical protein MBLNU13_g09266t1 [Cladosporium sp. NU13]